MNKLLIAVALCAALTACKKEEAAPAADAAAPAAETAAPAADAPAAPAAETAAAPAASSLPKECEDYIARAQACFDKSSNNAASAALKQAFEDTRAQWAASPYKDTLGVGCKAANDAFAQTAAMLKCE
ncbi:MAG: hypothetical protein IT472_06730 [Thermomonas sp.]|uniref:hypothetical protein n=1 Tax=Thermomonas sp. TaxID=1971895 RepID=UPI00260A512D|nr:hypothetical protein [Thermomonas sp.]MCC7096854.1 hypothetical protein [Thermomonas sp.]